MHFSLGTIRTVVNVLIVCKLADSFLEVEETDEIELWIVILQHVFEFGTLQFVIIGQLSTYRSLSTFTMCRLGLKISSTALMGAIGVVLSTL